MGDIVDRWPHRRIYLEPLDCADPSTGPLWAQADIGSDDEGGNAVAWEPYVKESEITRLKGEVERLTNKLADAEIGLSCQIVEADTLRAENERLRTMVREAYNAGFGQGMKDFTSSRGGKTWVDSRFPAELAALTAAPAAPEQEKQDG